MKITVEFRTENAAFNEAGDWDYEVAFITEQVTRYLKAHKEDPQKELPLLDSWGNQVGEVNMTGKRKK